MQVKVFEAEDMAAALKQVKASLGPDAIILSTRTVKRKGVGGLLARPLVEVTAAIEAPPARPRPGVNPYAAAMAAQAAPAPEVPPARRSRPVIEPLEDEVRQLRELVAGREQGAGAEVQSLRQEMEQLKQLVQGLATPPAPARTAPTPAVAAPAATPSPLADELVRLGVEPAAAATIASYAGAQARPAELADPARRRRLLHTTIASLVQSCPPLTVGVASQRRIALVGPTGVGKTTTIAKLAAEALLRGGLRVALITADTYRIAAVEQLKVYGEIMDLPVEVALSPAELQAAIARHRDKDLILIDTAGRSPRDSAQIDDLLALVGEGDIEAVLVLAAPTREKEQERIVRRFSRLPLSSLIITKLDECEAPGVLLNICARTSLPLACLANGQRVPEDLLPADPDAVAELILSMDGDEA